jgi:hypothetical protein
VVVFGRKDELMMGPTSETGGGICKDEVMMGPPSEQVVAFGTMK